MENHSGPLLLLHIPKTGGMTLRAIVTRQYSARTTYIIDNSVNESIIQFRTMPAVDRARIQCLSGHMSYGLHELMAPSARYLTMLREPLRRARSDYQFVSTNRLHPLYATVSGMTFAEYMRSGITGQLSNGQTRLICGDSAPDNSGIPTNCALSRADLDRAFGHIEERFPVVGIQERFDESLILMRRHFGWPLPYYAKQNVTQCDAGTGSIDCAGDSVVGAQNKLDIALYRYVLERFERQLTEQHWSYRWELRALRTVNRLYQGLGLNGWLRIKRRIGAFLNPGQ